MYIEVEIFLNGNQKPAYTKPFESDFEFLQPTGFSGYLLFLLQLQELYLERSYREIPAYPFDPDYPDCALDLQKCKKRQLYQYGCFKQEAALLALYLYHHRNGHLFGSGFLSS